MSGEAGHAPQPLVVVVPVYNEGENLRGWFREMGPFLPDGAKVRIVYDRDDDDTLPVARELIAGGAPLELLKNSARGVRTALLTGLASVPSGPVLVSMADLSDEASVLPRMLERYREGATVVVASRYMRGGRQIGGVWLKRALARWGAAALYHLAHFPVHDATNNFRLYDAAFVRELTLSSDGGFEIAFEITLEAWRRGKRVEEVPSVWRDRVAGKSRFRLMAWLPRYGRLWWEAFSFGAFHQDKRTT